MGKTTCVILLLVLCSANAENWQVSRRQLGGSQSRLGIYGGHNTTIKHFPYVVGILYPGGFLGQGCIISRRWVLSTADNIAYSTNLTIVSGSNDGIHGQRHEVAALYTHPDYDMFSFECDYGLAKIKDKFTWSSTVRPVKLPSRRPKVNSWLAVAGWGPSSYDGTDENTVLKAGKQRWIDKSVCPTLIWDIDFDDSLGCAYYKGHTTLCDGDWGDVYVQHGVVYGMFITGTVGGNCGPGAGGCALADVYGGLDWINNCMKKGQCSTA